MSNGIYIKLKRVFYMTLDKKNRLLNSFLIAFLLTFTLLIFGELMTYLGNIGELSYSLVSIFAFFSIMFLFSLILLTFIFSLFSEKVIYIFFIAALLISIQSNFMVWSYGEFDGLAIKWSKYFYYGIIDTLVWAAVIFIAVKKRDLLLKNIRLITVMFISFEIVVLLLTIFSNNVFEAEKKRWFKNIELTENINFSKNQNVIVWLLDMTESEIFEEIIDEREEYKSYFKDFTYYKDYLAATPYTNTAISPLFTTKVFDNQESKIDFCIEAFSDPSHSILKILKNSDYNIDMYMTAKDQLSYESYYIDNKVVSNTKKRKIISKETKSSLYLLDFSLMRASPHILKRFIYNNGRLLFFDFSNRVSVSTLFFNMKKDKKESEPLFESTGEPLSKSEDSVKIVEEKKNDSLLDRALHPKDSDGLFVRGLINGSSIIDKNCFSFFHLDGAHVPFNFDEDGNYIANPKENKDSYKGKYIYSLKLTKLFLDYLMSKEIYDNSLIIILGDHGASSGAIENNRPILAEKVRGSALFMMKRPNETNVTLREKSSKISAFDIEKTILEIMNVDSKNISGDSIDSIKESEERLRKFYYHGFGSKDRLNYLPTIYEYSVSGVLKENNSWRLTGKLFIKNEIIDFLDKKAISKANFQREIVSKIDNTIDREFVLSLYSETENGFVIKDIDNESKYRLIDILIDSFAKGL